MSDDILVEFVSGPDSEADAAELEQLTQALRAEILQLDDVDSVEQASAGPAPAGTKALELAAIGSLLVSVAPGAAGKVFQLVRAWLAGRPSPPPLKITYGENTIELVPNDDQQDALVQHFIKMAQAGQSGQAAPPGTTTATEG